VDFEMHALEQFYPGDEKWHRFVDMFDEFVSRQEVQDLAKKLNGDVKLAAVIYGSVGSGSEKWIASKIPALDDISPFECIGDSDLLNRLRTALMRMPR
jgi:hypothetical protein